MRSCPDTDIDIQLGGPFCKDLPILGLYSRSQLGPIFLSPALTLSKMEKFCISVCHI